MTEKAQDHKAHQAELAQSGYRIPDSFYVEDPQATQQSAEQTSGDGGANADTGSPAQSAHGYKGTTLTPEALAKEQAAKAGAPSGAGTAGAVTYASSAAEQAAADAKLTAADFQGVTPSSEKGYTKADVDEIAAKKSGDAQG